MADFCLQVIVNEATHVISDPAKDARRYRRGDIIDVFIASDIGTLDVPSGDYIPNEPIGSSRLGFIFVKDAPDVSIDKAKAWLSRQELNAAQVENPDVLKRRIMQLDVPSIPPAVRQEILDNKYITFGWTVVRDFILNKTTLATVIDSDLTSL